MLSANTLNRFSRLVLSNRIIAHKFSSKIDYSKVPKLVESEIEEDFVRGSGPGGQSVNKTANKVVIKHVPSGIVVNCHKTRSLEQNRTEARKILIAKLDELINKEDSVEAQVKRIEIEKKAKSKSKRVKLDELKKQWKDSLSSDKIVE